MSSWYDEITVEKKPEREKRTNQMTNIYTKNRAAIDTMTRQPLTNDQLFRMAPSVFAAAPWSGMSEKYAFIPTINVVDQMRQEGFAPVSARQSVTRIEGKADFTRHVIRFRDIRNGDAPVSMALGGLYPEIVVTNAHDGGSAYKIDAGLFRLVCFNGLICAIAEMAAMKVRHSGNVDGVIEASYEVVGQFPSILDNVDGFARTRLNAPQAQAFATAALQLRYDDAAPIEAARVIEPRRVEDTDANLWTVMNVAQENLTQGGIRGVATNPETNQRRRFTTRPVNGISENTRLNKALWTLAEEMKKLVS